ncbi:hypothetical protein DRQ53_01890 [bacterium]|nr:MAG: hypothetical protein DRQ53_01890 [bacterium]
MCRAILLALLLGAAQAASGQEVSDIRDLVPRSIEYGGHSELFTEAYTVNGRQARRPSGTARLLLRPYMRIGETFELTANVLLSTEQRSFGGDGRQKINRIGITPAWGWGSAQLGDFNYAYTPLTYEGIPMRGGALHLEPGWLRFSALGGVTQRAVAGDASNGSYGRQLYAGRIGVGQTDGSWFDLIALYADDDEGSLQSEPFYDEDDSTLVGTVAPTSITPQENLVLGAATQISAFARKLVWSGEFAGSAYTRDKRAREVDDSSSLDIPVWLSSVFTPRIGTSLDYAWSTDLRLRVPRWDLSGEYKYVGPGYRSLGVGSLLVDRRVLRGRAAFQSRTVTGSVNASLQRDNVLGQKLDTTRRNALGSIVSYRPRRNLLTTLQATFSTMLRNTSAPDQRIDYLSQVYGAGARLSLRRRWVRSVGLDYRLQKADDANPVRSSSGFLSHQLTAPVGLQLTDALHLTPNVGVVFVRHPVDGWRTTHTERLTLRHSGMARRWVSTFTVGTSFDEGTRRLVLSANSNLRVSERSRLRLVLRNNDFRARQEAGSDWSEFIARLSLETRW